MCMARWNPLWRLPARIVLLCGLIALVAASCGGKRGAGPHESSSRVYVSIDAKPSTVLVFDTRADSLIDSVKLPTDGSIALLSADPRSARFAVLNEPDLFLY